VRCKIREYSAVRRAICSRSHCWFSFLPRFSMCPVATSESTPRP
jgi:hypothetical protein